MLRVQVRIFSGLQTKGGAPWEHGNDSNVNRLPLAAGDRVHVADARRKAMLRPGDAAILGVEDLPASARAMDLVRVSRMQRHGHHCRLGLDVAVETRPGFAQV